MGWVLIGGSPVITKAAPQCAGLGIGPDVFGDFRSAWWVFVDGPVLEDMAQIDLLPTLDELFREVELLMEL